MKPPVFATLKASAAVKAIVGTNPPRIFRHGDAPQDTAKPYVTWEIEDIDPANNLSAVPVIDRVTVTLHCWHPTDAGIVLLVQTVRDAIEPHAHMVGAPVDEREPQTRLFHMATVFDWFVNRGQ